MTDTNLRNIEESVRTILTELGEDPDRQGLEKTPLRVAKMYKEVTRGYRESPEKLILPARKSSFAKFSVETISSGTLTTALGPK